MTRTTKQLSIVLPVRLDDQRLDLIRLFEVALRSVDTFLDKSALAEILIIASADDIRALKSYESTMTVRLNLSIRYIDELSVCPAFGRMGGAGWFKQQVLKIASANLASTNMILILDDDVFMTRPATFSDFVPDGKIIYAASAVHFHKEYYESSCEVLQVPYSIYTEGEHAICVTPQILRADVLIGLQKEIENIWKLNDFGAWLLQVSHNYYPKTPRSLLARIFNRICFRILDRRDAKQKKLRDRCGNWSEYSLYATYLKKHNLKDYYHDYTTARNVPQLFRGGVWTDAQFKEMNLDDWLAETFSASNTDYFAVFSARIQNVDRADLYGRIIRHLCYSR